MKSLKRINEILKSLKSAGSLIDKQYKKIKAVGFKPCVLYGFVKFTKQLLFVHLLELYYLQLKHPIIKLLNFKYLYRVS